jgi:hypothetical protein
MTEEKDRARFKKGDNVVYTSNSGIADVAVILKVHFEDDPPFYTISFTERGVEKQTDEKNLTYLPLFDDDEDEDKEDVDPLPVATPGPVSFSIDKSISRCQFGMFHLGVGLGFVAAIGGLLVLTFSKNRRS